MINAATRFQTFEVLDLAKNKWRAILKYREQKAIEAEEYKQELIKKYRKRWWPRLFRWTDEEIFYEYVENAWGGSIDRINYRSLVYEAENGYNKQYKVVVDILAMAENTSEKYMWLTDEGYGNISE